MHSRTARTMWMWLWHSPARKVENLGIGLAPPPLHYNAVCSFVHVCVILWSGETWCISQWQQYAGDWCKEGEAERDAVKTNSTTHIKAAKTTGQKWKEEEDTGEDTVYVTMLLFDGHVINLLYRDKSHSRGKCAISGQFSNNMPSFIESFENSWKGLISR